MRFIAAIAVFAVSAILLVVGVSFKILAGPQTIITTLDLSNVNAPYLVIDPAVVQANPGLETVNAAGGSSSFIGYGRTADVLAWIGDSTYATVRYDRETNELAVADIVEPPKPDASGAEGEAPVAVPTPVPVVSPAGSDLWLDERVGKTTTSLTLNATPDMSVLVSGDGAETVPDLMTISWPLPRATFLWLNDDNLIFLGGALAIIGLFLYLWTMSDWRNQQGPPRRGR